MIKMTKLLFILSFCIFTQTSFGITIQYCSNIQNVSLTRGNAAGDVDWTLIQNGDTMLGLGFCSSDEGYPSTYYSMDTISISYGSNDKYCWCRIISPVLSRWTHPADYKFSTATECRDYCAARCGYSMGYDTGFVNEILTYIQ